jgi:glycosyltransferase involved in cell wall biosynthesis
MKQKLLFVATEFPYPPVHGGRADTWQRIVALAEAGAELQLVCWTSSRRGGEPSPQELDTVRAVVADLVVLPIRVGPVDLLWRLLNLWRMPSHASARLPWGRAGRDLLARVRAFDAGVVWIDALWPAAWGRQVARRLGWPYYYRSHNVEHRYMAGQAQMAAPGFYKLRLQANLPGLERFERQVVLEARAVFDISMDDLRYWQSQGLLRGHWLPPIVRVREVPPLDAEAQRFDIVFVGNLHTPNNVEAVRWLLADVWPAVLQARPQATALIAGFAPSPEVRALVGRAPGATLLADPEDVWPLYAAARVLVNPAQRGSGVNIKSVEMLHFDAPVVSTPVGTGGLPEDIRAAFHVAAHAPAFAAAILSALAVAAMPASEARLAARAAFGAPRIREVLSLMAADRLNGTA